MKNLSNVSPNKIRKNITIIPGEGAAAEAVHWSFLVLKNLDVNIDFYWIEDPPVDPMARSEWLAATKDQIDRSDATLFGACAVHFIDILVYLRWGKNAYANVRPIKWMNGFASPLKDPSGIDFIIVRENIEDLYVGLEGSVTDLPFPDPINSLSRQLIPLTGGGRYSVKINTLDATQRIARKACEIAVERKASGYPGKLTVSAKSNLLSSDRFFCNIAQDICKSEYPELLYEEFLIDDFARRIVCMPKAFDVVLLPNLYGDIISDEAAATVGGLGLCGSGCYGNGFAYFEPVHGAVLDLVGKNCINPTATLLSCCMLLRYLGFHDKANHLEQRLEQFYATGKYLTPDQGGRATTEEFCKNLLKMETLYA